MNGEAYLQAQLDSFKTQTHANWSLWVSDDGSSDQTHAILARFKSSLPAGRVNIVKGPQQGFAANFLSLLAKVAQPADFYAYSDQDDIWLPQKLQLAVQNLRALPVSKPALYCTRTELIDSNGKHLGFSKHWPRQPAFQNALTQNIGGGNTMVFNWPAQQLLTEAGSQLEIIAHDWWTYLVVSACGGEVVFDATPTLQYRQHANNAIGANHELTAPLRSVQRLMAGRYKQWNTHNLAGLQRLHRHLPAHNQTILQTFARARTAPFFSRLRGVYQSGVYRQTFSGNLGLILATVFKRI